MRSNTIFLIEERLFGNRISFDEVRDALEGVLRRSACTGLHVFDIDLTHARTSGYCWQTVFNFFAEAAASATDLADQLRHLFGNASSGSMNLCLVTNQFHFGEERDGAALITSCYDWQRSVGPARRHANMLEHLEMERCQRLYQAVHFNEVRNDSGLGPRFLFASYLESDEAIEAVYEQPLLIEMRAHSQSFLNIETRRLAFGRVYIVLPDLEPASPSIKEIFRHDTTP